MANGKGSGKKKARGGRLTNYQAPSSTDTCRKGAKKFPPMGKGGMRHGHAANQKLCRTICSQIDPFCTSACGAKIMDNNRTSTVSFQSKSFVTLSSLASNNAAIMISPAIHNSYRLANSIVGDNVVATDPWVTIPEEPSLSVSFSEYRCVSFGVRVFGSAALATSQGTVTIATMPSTGSTGWNISSSMYTDLLRVPLNDCEVTWVSSPTAVDAQEFVSNAAGFIPHMSVCSIMLDGVAASTPCVGIEITYNYELRPTVGNFAAHLASGPSPSAPDLVAAAATVASKRKAAQVGTVAARSKTFMDLANEAVGWLSKNPDTMWGLLELL